MKVLVAGARGRLGSGVAREFRSRGDVVALGRADLDITDDRRVLKRITAESPDLIINCAAYTAVDAAQNDPLSALHVNAFGVRALARAAAAVDATLVHYGSDFVFDGRANRPYVESDRPNPQSVYAMSKLLGEWFAADAPRHYVLRVESLFSQTGDGPATGSAATIVARLRAGDEVPVFVDRTVTPTYVVDAAAATMAIVERKLPSGVYHCVNSGHCTWWEFAEEAARTEADLRLHDLKARTLRVPPRVEEAEKARAHVGLAQHDEHSERRHQQEAAGERAPTHPRCKQDGGDHQCERDRGAEIGLEQDEHQETANSAPIGRHSSCSVRGGLRLARYAASHTVSASFASSDGWNVAGPKLIHLRAPLIGWARTSTAAQPTRAQPMSIGESARSRVYFHREATTMPATPSTAYVPCRSRYDIGLAPPTTAEADVAL